MLYNYKHQRERKIPNTRKVNNMKFNINSCKRGNWQIKEQVTLGIGTFYLLTDADGYYRHAQIAREDGSVMNEEVHSYTLAVYAARSKYSRYADEQAFSAAYRQWVIDKFVKDFTFVSDCFLSGWNKEQQMKYFYAPAENSVELAAFAYKTLGLDASDAVILFGTGFLGASRPLFRYEQEELLGYSPESDARFITMDTKTLDRVWNFMCKLQNTHEEKGDAFWWDDKLAARIFKDITDLKQALRIALEKETNAQ